MVGVSRFERPTTRTPSECATRLRHTPIFNQLNLLEDFQDLSQLLLRGLDN